MARTHPPVMGHDLPGPRLTRAGWGLLALWVGAPALALIVVSDLLGWVVAQALFDVCFGLVCYL
ncbi:hypothetical protein [Rubrimonas cliftonensis]|uniref:Uncharacterized protein n=1 Tax=Rubrimonas cliftonensis TaxID=89524 RepID=A0A1H4BS40_9RHOB|nr:hypothetical protein [Rubrimonas cliftonensis]SEA50919.1 hypothetical protein SAMN05444370_10618 [Rubrimonas cliftonensis]